MAENTNLTVSANRKKALVLTWLKDNGRLSITNEKGVVKVYASFSLRDGSPDESLSIDEEIQTLLKSE